MLGCCLSLGDYLGLAGSRIPLQPVLGCCYSYGDYLGLIENRIPVQPVLGDVELLNSSRN